MNLIPNPKKTDIKEGFLSSKNLKINNLCNDYRIEKALAVFCIDENAPYVVFNVKTDALTEGYILDISEKEICLQGKTSADVFYGIQTLKQIFTEDTVNCLFIQDSPDMEYRGVYHDVTRGRVPKIESIKKLVDKLAYYKINSLQLYIEHTFPFKEFGDAVLKFGYLTPEEIKELDDYCYDNFIEFIPSIATFGHLFELLQLPKYTHLQCLDNYTQDKCTWIERMQHHTIDPENPESIEIIKSMIDQYLPLFRSDKFNICCDETFDLKTGKHKDKNTGSLYLNFVKQIIDHLKSKGKKVMMWGDILLQHSEIINELPKDTYFLNWDYSAKPNENSFKTFSELGCTQYVCPGTGGWNRMIEGMRYGTENIVNTIDYGKKYGAKGVLNTNWGDWGHPCDLDLSMHGLILGAAKSWNTDTCADDEFDVAINKLEYKNQNAVKYMKELDKINDSISYMTVVSSYSENLYNNKKEHDYPDNKILNSCIKSCQNIISEIKNEVWEEESYKEALLVCAEALMVMGGILQKLAGYDECCDIDIDKFLSDYRIKWLKDNKESELCEIEKLFSFYK